MKKLISVFLCFVMIMSTGVMAFADNNCDLSSGLNTIGLSDEAIEFLQAHNVDISVFDEVSSNAQLETTKNTSKSRVSEIEAAGSYNEAVLSLMRQTEANNFDDLQIQEYVDGLVNTPTTIVDGSGSNTLRAVNRPNDDGIGYEVKSKNGYYESTAYAYLPSVTLPTNNDSAAYMMFTVNELIDLGIWYHNGSGGNAWRGFYMINGNLTSGNTISALTSGSYVYFVATVTTTGYARIRILDGNNFNNVHYDISYYVANSGVTRANANLNRQITLTSATKNFTNGAKVGNAKFTNAYLYSSSGYSLASSANTVSTRVGIFGTNSTTARKVSTNPNGTSQWYREDVTINFR